MRNDVDVAQAIENSGHFLCPNDRISPNSTAWSRVVYS
jgi:predicted nucleotidyltransferase